MITLTTTFETAASVQSHLSLTDLFILWHLLVRLDEVTRRHKRRIAGQKRTHDAARAAQAKRRKTAPSCKPAIRPPFRKGPGF